MKKILVVDDDYAIRLLYKIELEDEGYDVRTTTEYINLMDQIDYLKPDLIVLDIRLGEMNGLDILQEIRTRYYDMPVILCSAYPSYRYDIKAIAADYYVTKSIDLSDLKFKIKMAFENTMGYRETPVSQGPEHHSLESQLQSDKSVIA